MAEPKTVDWEGVEREYRAGILTLREIGKQFSVSHTAIGKRATKEGWARDLTAKIKAKAEALVSKDAVSKEVATGNRVSEAQIVEANAIVVANVDRRHKETAKKGQQLVDALLAEISATTEHIDLFHQVGEMLDNTKTTDSGKVIEDKLNKLYRAVISTEGRVDSLKKLADTFEKFGKFERVAYRLDDVKPPEDPADSLTPQRVQEGLRRIAFLLHAAAHKPQEPAHA